MVAAWLGKVGESWAKNWQLLAVFLNLNYVNMKAMCFTFKFIAYNEI